MAAWQPRPFAHFVPGLYADWLTEPGSLTARCQRACREFRIRLLSYRRESSLDARAGRQALVLVREVLLECDGVPVIFAHTELARRRGRLAQWLARLGRRSLGSLLFAYPGFRRGPLEYCRLDRRHPLYGRAIRLAGIDERIPTLWARRCIHHLDGQAVQVTEVFLPAILDLREPPPA